MEKCTAQITVTGITLEMDTGQAIVIWDLIGGMDPTEAEKYISNENYAKLYTLWQELDRELSKTGLVS